MQITSVAAWEGSILWSTGPCRGHRCRISSDPDHRQEAGALQLRFHDQRSKGIMDVAERLGDQPADARELGSRMERWSQSAPEGEVDQSPGTDNLLGGLHVLPLSGCPDQPLTNEP